MNAQDIDLIGKIQFFVTEKIAPGVMAHGGMVEIQSLENGVLKLALSGSCTTCSMDAMTKEGIAEFVMSEFPDLDDCEVIDLIEENEDSSLSLKNPIIP